MAKNQKTSSSTKVSDASKILNDPNSSKIQKKLAGSVLSQHKSNKQTGSEMENIASKVLNSDKYNQETKSLAGSVLSQSNVDR